MVQTSRPTSPRAMEIGRAGVRTAPPPWPGSCHNLPSSYTTFIGREREMEELGRLLDTIRLLTLSGTGGVGKSRVALELAAQQLNAFPDGVWWVELGSLADPSLVEQRVATVLDVREMPGRPLIDTLAAALRPNATLLVLDNCEHLVETCAQVADSLLRRCPALAILATSRQPLGLPGETVWRVPSLQLPAGSDMKQDLLTAAAVRLLVDRAAAARPGFALNQRNGPIVLDICRRLDGIPLSLELAAARLKTLSVEQLAARLGDCLSVLAAGSPAALPRQRTLRATVDWSYDLLSAEEQLLFRRLSVFAGGFTLEAAEAVCAEEGLGHTPMLDLLCGLAEKSLLQVDERDGKVRYRLLETLRMYGSEKLRECGA